MSNKPTEIDALKGEIEKLNKTIEKLTSENDEAKKTIEKLSAKLDSSASKKVDGIKMTKKAPEGEKGSDGKGNLVKYAGSPEIAKKLEDEGWKSDKKAQAS